MIKYIKRKLKNILIWTAIDIEMRKNNQKYAKDITKLHFSNLWKRLRVVQVPLQSVGLWLLV